LPEARLILERNKNFIPPTECKFKLSGEKVREKMLNSLQKLYEEKKILDHGLEVGKKLAYVLSGGKTDLNKELSEDDLYNLELEAFMELIQTVKTQERIKYTLETGKPLIN
jgi:3-hydroxyacyl-CoA dehydrogenase